MKYMLDGEDQLECGVHAPATGYRCDSIVLSASDIRRLIHAMRRDPQELALVMEDCWLPMFTPESIGK